MNTIIASAFFVVFTTSPAYSLQCYNCDSSASSICNVGLISFAMPVQDCSEKSGDNVADIFSSIVPKQCVKITAKDSHGSEYVARGCIPYTGGACNVVFKTLGFFSGLSGGASDVNCYTCDSDKCNSSSTIKPSLVAIVILSILSAVSKF